jgi:hypothetical protein
MEKIEYICKMKRLVLIGLLLLALATTGYSQGCSVCTKTAAGMDDKSAKGLNGGIVYLAMLPLGLMGTIGLIWWRYNKNSK